MYMLAAMFQNASYITSVCYQTFARYTICKQLQGVNHCQFTSRTSTDKFLLHAMYIYQQQVHVTCMSETYRQLQMLPVFTHRHQLSGKQSKYNQLQSKVYYTLELQIIIECNLLHILTYTMPIFRTFCNIHYNANSLYLMSYTMPGYCTFCHIQCSFYVPCVIYNNPLRYLMSYTMSIHCTFCNIQFQFTLHYIIYNVYLL